MKFLSLLTPSNILIIVLVSLCSFLGINNYLLKNQVINLQKNNGELVSRVEILKANLTVQNDKINDLKKASDDYKAGLVKAKKDNDWAFVELKKRQAKIDSFKFSEDCNTKLYEFKIKLIEFGKNGN